tara:strand:+ start:19128 stop:19550 length:423 start_codon:yes stop_codon:yes gene_type:complete
MFKFFNKENKKNVENPIIKIAALLIHVAKVDESYTEKEKEIITKAIIELGAKNELASDLLSKAEELEKNSNQILDFTKEVKNIDEDSKIKIIEVLWKIVYSDNNSDMYESTLMRRLSGLLYLDPKIVGDVKERIINNLKK